MSAPKQLSVFDNRLPDCLRALQPGWRRARRGRLSMPQCAAGGSAKRKLDPLPHVKGHHGWTSALAFHPKEPWLLSGDTWGQLRARPSRRTNRKRSGSSTRRTTAGCARSPSPPTARASPPAGATRPCGSGRLTASPSPSIATTTTSSRSRSRRRAASSSSAISTAHLHAWDFAAEKITRTFDATVLYKTDRIQDIGGLRVLAFLADGKRSSPPAPRRTKARRFRARRRCFPSTSRPASCGTNSRTARSRTASSKISRCTPTATSWPSPAATPATASCCSSGRGKGRRSMRARSSRTATPSRCTRMESASSSPRTNRNSNGNGRVNAKDGSYAVNTSPVNLFELPA